MVKARGNVSPNDVSALFNIISIARPLGASISKTAQYFYF